MRIQKGQVKYKDRDDIIVSYGITEDGRSYYFLDENDERKFVNGNRIASTVLKEAIDPMVEASHMGVVDEAGNEIIPFTNRAIRPITDQVILVMLATPISQNVIEVEQVRKDALAASQLLNRSNEIKKKLSSQMGADGRYIFNNLFSEATIYDIYGNNLVGGEYYSFIGINNGKLYLSKNTVESEVVEFSLYTPVENQAIVNDEVNNNMSQELNVNNVEVPQEVVENALVNDNGITSNNSNLETQPESNNESNNNVDDTNGFDLNSVYEDLNSVQTVGVPVEDNVVGSVPTSLDTAQVEVPQEVSVTNENNVEETAPTNLDTAQVEVPQEVNVPVENNVEETAPTNLDTAQVEVPQEVNIPVVEEETISNEKEIDENNLEEDLPDLEESSVEKEAKSITYNDVMSMVEDPVSDETFEDTSEKYEFKNDIFTKDIDEDDNFEFDIKDEDTTLDSLVGTTNKDENYDDLFKDSLIKVDSISNNAEDDYFYDDVNQENDANMVDIADSLENLLKKYHEQKSVISDYKIQLEKVNHSRKSLNRDLKLQEQKIESLTERLKNLESALMKLESRNDFLESKVQEQEDLIEKQNRELNVLKPQLKGKDKLVKIYSEAKALLEEESYKNKYTY